MVVGFQISAYHHNRWNSNPAEGEMYAMQHYVIKFVSELRQGGVFFLRVLPLVPSIKSSFVSEKVKAIERLINYSTQR
jgi:hypothetical protein